MLRPYLIWSTYHGAWWQANAAGYTTRLAEAGVFVHQKFEHSHEVAVPIEKVRGRIHRRRAELLDELIKLNALEAALDGVGINAEPDRPVADISACPVAELELSVRAMNVLTTANVTTVGDLVKLSRFELLQLKNMGRRTVNEIIDTLRGLRLKLRDDNDRRPR